MRSESIGRPVGFLRLAPATVSTSSFWMASWLDSSLASEITTIGQARFRRSLNQRADAKSSFAVWKVPYLSPGIEEVVGELSLERVDHPGGKALPDEVDHRSEGRLRCQGTSGLSMNVSPVDDRSYEAELLGQKGDVAKGAEVSFGSAGLEAEADPHVFDLG